MAMAKLPPCHQDPPLQSMRRTWVWEYVLKHCTSVRLLNALFQSYPIPPRNPSLTRLYLLNRLSVEVVEGDCFSEGTLEILSELSSFVAPPSSSPSRSSSLSALRDLPRRFHAFSANKGGYKGKPSFSFAELVLEFRVECTVQHLRNETKDWPKFCELLDKMWSCNMKPEKESKKRKKNNTIREQGSELRLELKESEDEDEDEKGDEAEDEDDDDKGIKERFFHLKQNLLDVKNNPELRHDLLRKFKREKVRRMVQGFVCEAWESLGSVFLEQVADNVKKGLYLPEGFSPPTSPIAREDSYMCADSSGSESTKDVDNVSIRKSSANVSFGKNLGNVSNGKSLDSTGEDNLGNTSTKICVEQRPSSTVVEKDGYKDMEGSSSTFQGKRKIPVSLKEKPKANLLSSSNLGDVQLIEEMQAKASNFQRPIETLLLDTVHVNVSYGKQVEETEKVISTTNNVIQEGGDKSISPGPPPWTGSAAPDSSTITRNKRRKIGAFSSKYDHANGSDSICRNTLDSPEIRKAQTELMEVQESLNAVVKDPLPEAIKIAEEAAKLAKSASKVPGCLEETSRLNDGDQGQQSRPPEEHVVEMKTVSPARMRGSERAFDKKQARSIMDRHPTARTIEWSASDDVNDSPQKDDSPSCSKQVRLPTLRPRESITRMKGALSRNLPNRRKIRRWTLEEENTLRSEVERYGKGHWKHILQKHSAIFESRTEVDLKDKWRNIEKREGGLP